MDIRATSLATLTAVPSWIHERLVRLRNRAYDTGWLTENRLPRPVISIGNLTMGGTGKTPLVCHVAQILLDSGHRPAILTRGYGRHHPRKTWILPPGCEIHYPDEVIGDEPALLRRRLPETWMGVSKNRYAAGARIASREPQAVFLLDDGFQHRRLRRDLDIVIIDPGLPLDQNHVFPRGSLREPSSGLQRCHMIVINGSLQENQTVRSADGLHSLSGGKPVFFCTQRIRALYAFEDWQAALLQSRTREASDSVPPSAVRTAYLVAAIGNPLRFQKDVERFGITVPGATFFRDHHRMRPGELDVCIENARRLTVDAVIVTEKDAVKIRRPPVFPLLVAVQSLDISDGAAFHVRIDEVLKHCPAGPRTGSEHGMKS